MSVYSDPIERAGRQSYRNLLASPSARSLADGSVRDGLSLGWLFDRALPVCSASVRAVTELYSSEPPTREYGLGS